MLLLLNNSWDPTIYLFYSRFSLCAPKQAHQWNVPNLQEIIKIVHRNTPLYVVTKPMQIAKLSGMPVKLVHRVLLNFIHKELVRVTQSWLCFVYQMSEERRLVQDIILERVGFPRSQPIALNKLVGRRILILVWRVGMSKRFTISPENVYEMN